MATNEEFLKPYFDWATATSENIVSVVMVSNRKDIDKAQYFTGSLESTQSMLPTLIGELETYRDKPYYDLQAGYDDLQTTEVHPFNPKEITRKQLRILPNGVFAVGTTADVTSPQNSKGLLYGFDSKGTDRFFVISFKKGKKSSV